MIRKLILSLLTVLLQTGVAWSVPAHPGMLTVTQPDGTTLTLQLLGDEFLHYSTTHDGYTVLQNDDGYYVYAERQADGQLAPTHRIARDEGQRTADDRAFLQAVGKRLAPPMNGHSSQMRQQELNLRRQARAARQQPQYDYTKFRGLIILVQYNDRQFSRNDYATLINDMVNKENYTGYSNSGKGRFTGSVRDYFYDNSDGLFTPQFDVVGPVTINYSQYYAKGFDNAYILTMAAIDAVNAEVNFAQYDGDGDHVVDMVYFIFAGPGSNYSGNDQRLIWPHASVLLEQRNGNYYYAYRDNVKLDRYACSTELAGWVSGNNTYIDGIGTICHEFSHVLGLPDLYDTNYDENGQSHDPGLWSLMAGGSYQNNSRTPVGYGLYERYAAGFAMPQTLQHEDSYTLPSIATSNQGFRINSEVNNEFFLLENRQQTDKWDAYLPGHGLLVFRVDSTNASVWEQNKVNIKPSRNYYEMLRAGGETEGDNDSDPFPGTARVTSLTNETTPANLLSWAKKKTRYVLEDIAENNGSVSFNVVDIYKTPDDPEGSVTVKYWFDDQKELAGITEDFDMDMQLDVSTLSEGLHALHLAVCQTDEEGEYRELAPQTVFFVKPSADTKSAFRCLADGKSLFSSKLSNGPTFNYSFTLNSVDEGLHQLALWISTADYEKPLIQTAWFQKVLKANEMTDLNLSVSIDGMTPIVLERAFEDNSLTYDLDVSDMQPGIHTLTYQVKGRLQTSPEKTFFAIDPKLNGYDYWLNNDRETMVHTNITPVTMPFEIEADLPVRSMPLRPDNFRFNVEEGIPVTYAVNDFTFQATTDNGYWDYLTAQYLDTGSRQPVGSILLPQNDSVTVPLPSEGAGEASLKWFHLKARQGDTIGLRASRPCTLQLFSPVAEEVYTATGSAAQSVGGLEAPEDGTYYLALHTPTDEQGEGDMTVTFFYTSSQSILSGDVNGDGKVDFGDIVAVAGFIAGIESNITLRMADVNDDGQVGIGDIVAITNIMAKTLNSRTLNPRNPQ